MRTAEIVALSAGALATVLLLLPKSSTEHRSRVPDLLLPILGCIGLAVLGFGIPDKALAEGLKMAALCGLLPSLLSAWNSDSRATSALGFAAGAYGAYLVRNPADPSTYPALLGAAGLGLLALMSRQDPSAAIGMALSSCSILFWKFLGSADPRGFALMGLIMAPAVAAVVFAVGERWMSSPKWLPLALATLAVSIAGFAGAGRLLTELEFRWCPAVGAILALVIVVLTDGANNTTQRRMLAAAILVSSGLFAYTLGRMPGLAVSAGASAVILALSGRAMLSLIAVPVAVVLLRAIRIEAETTRMALELGPHQTIMGVMVGVVAVALAWETLRGSRNTTSKEAIGRLLTGILVLGASAATPVFLNERAVPGIFLGLCLGAMLANQDPNRADRPTALAIAGGAGLYGLYPTLVPFMDLVRDEKVKILIWSSVAGLALVFLALWLLKNSDSQPSEVAST